MQPYQKILGLICGLALLPALLVAQAKKTADKDLTVEEYIARYKEIAIQEMERSGIPASITLAQGIHESAFGNSELARKAKNHFGIKCTKDWEGKTMYKWDDEARKSCFRFYSSAEDSYVDHTDFLMNRRHYAFLFEYKRDDYKRWAKGLRKAGYATDPRYPDKLIKTIEKYQLQQYDKVTGLLAYDTTRLAVDPVLVRGKRTKPRSFFFKRYKPGFYRTNGATYAISRKGESPLAVAKRFGIPYKRFLKFNDLEDGDQLIDYQPAYIQPKRSIYKGEEEIYRVEKDITMYEIAQEFGIKLSSLLALNLMKVGEEPANGESIQLKETALKRPKLRPSAHVDELPPKYVPEDKQSPIKTPVKPSPVVVIPKVERPKPQAVELNTPLYNPVVYADTTQINTSLSKNKDFLNAQIVSKTTTTTHKADGSTTTTTVIRRRRPNTTPTADVNNQTTNVIRRPANGSNQPANDPRVNNNALFPSNGTNNTVTKDTFNQTTKVLRRPQNSTQVQPYEPSNTRPKIGGYNNAGSTRDHHNNLAVTPSPVVPTVDETPNSNYKEHIVQKGETLYAIHRRYSVPVADIQKANNLSGTNILVGMRLQIPVK